MKIKKKLVLFVITINVATSFFCGYAKSDELNAVTHKKNDIKSIISNLPGKYGNINKIHFSGSQAPWVVYIKDYHCQYEVQHKINDILYYLTDSLKKPSLPICIEGAVGKVDTTLFVSIPDARIRSDVSDYFIKKGKISGTEFFCITNNLGPSLIGVDDVGLYNSSYSCYSEVLSGFLDYSDQINYIDNFINDVKASEFSESSSDILKYGISLIGDFSFENFILGTRKYWTKLSRQDVPESFIVLSDALNKKNEVSQDRIITLEKSLFDKVCKGNNQEKIKPLVKQYMLFQVGQINEAEFLKKLVRTARETGCLTEEYKELEDCLRLLTVFNNIDKKRLIEDCRKIYLSLMNNFFTDSETEYAKAVETWITVKKLLSLELTRESFEKFSQDQITHLFSTLRNVDNKSGNDKVHVDIFSFFSKLPSLVKDAGEFYSLSIKRDESMFINTVKAMESKNSNIAVLVAGGFHAEGLEKLLNKSGYNYAVITPSFLSGSAKNYYQEIMLLQATALDSIFPLQTANRLAPRVKLTNVLADPVLTNQLMKETVLVAKLLCIANSSELFEQLRAISQGARIQFRQQVKETVQDFGNKWMRKFIELQKQRGSSITDSRIKNLKTAIVRLVKFEEAVLKKENISLGIQVLGSSGDEIRMQVAFSEQKRMEDGLTDLLSDNLDPESLSMQERIGNFVFNFNKVDEKQEAVLDAQGKSPVTMARSSRTSTITRTLYQIDKLKKAVMADPYNTQLRIRLLKRLRRLSKFLQFAADKERKAGNMKKSLLLLANAKLASGDIEQAVRIFEEYKKYLSDAERNLAAQYFKAYTVIRGQKISLPITDDDGRTYVDRFGREIQSNMFDDTLTYGSEPSNMLQNRLIEQAGKLEAQNKKYLAAVTRSAAARLTDQNRNYHHFDIDAAFFTSDGENAYRNSILGDSSSSYGALMDGVRDDAFVRAYTPSVTYLYDRDYTDSLLKTGAMRYVSEDSALINTAMPADKITAVLVNQFHLPDALSVFLQYPSSDIPILDTKGNLLWQNAPLDEIAKTYGKEYEDVEARGGNYKQTASYAVHVKNPSKIVAMSDIHSDIEGMRLTLRQAGVIDENDNFIAGPDTVVVLNGDMIDRGNGIAQKKMLDFIMKLKKQAKKKNAEVIMTLGNHETMFLSGNWFPDSIKNLNDFLGTIGFKPRQAEELRQAFQENDLFTMGVLRSENPEAMKYIDFLWNLPIVAQVGGHVFVHGAATQAFNDELEKVLKDHPDWTAFKGIDYIFQRVISTHGFNSDYFGMNFKSILTGAPQMTPPPFAEKQEIVDRFLSFFDGATILAVGHNKALGVLGWQDKYSQIQRVGAARNIVKTDVGVNGYINSHKRSVESRAYIVDPKETDFVYSVSETGKEISLMRKNDTRFRFMRTEAASMYDTVLGAKSKEFLDRKDIPDSKDKPGVSENIRLFMNFQLMVFADSPEVIASAFETQTLKLYKKWPNVVKRPFNRERFPEAGEIQDLYFLYLEKLKLGAINPEDVSLSHFLDFIHNKNARIEDAITTKVMSTERVVDYETDVASFYSSMSQSEIKPLDNNMIHEAVSRLNEKMAEAKKDSYRMGMYIQEARHFLLSSEKLLSFMTMRSYDGKPGIFIGDDGNIPIMGFVLKDTVYLSQKLVTYLWNQYNSTGNIEYLDKLIALFAHEIHEYTSGQKVSKQRRKELHEEAEGIERFICGKGKKGSRLDDEIYALLDDWKDKTEHVRDQAVNKFFGQFRKYLLSQNNLGLYHRIFSALGVPIEANVIENVKVADNTLAILIREHPEKTFYAVKQAFGADPSFLFLILDYDMFSEEEILEFIAFLNESTLSVNMPIGVPAPATQPVAATYTIPMPAPKPINHRKRMRARVTVGSSI